MQDLPPLVAEHEATECLLPYAPFPSQERLLHAILNNLSLLTRGACKLSTLE